MLDLLPVNNFLNIELKLNFCKFWSQSHKSKNVFANMISQNNELSIIFCLGAFPNISTRWNSFPMCSSVILFFIFQDHLIHDMYFVFTKQVPNPLPSFTPMK